MDDGNYSIYFNSCFFMAKLIAQSGHSLDLPQRRVTLGESSACDIPLATGLGLAAKHFEIEPFVSERAGILI